MAAAYIVDAVRTAGGRRKGALSGIHVNDLGAISLNALVDRTGIDPSAVEDVIFGCVSQVGEQSQQVGRNCVLASKLPETVPAITIDRRCGSAQQAIHFAAQAVMAGVHDMVIAGGVEGMSRVPLGTANLEETGCSTYAPSILEAYGVKEFTTFGGAEMLAKKWGISREECDEYSYRSHLRAAAATEAGKFRNEIIPVTVTGPDGNTFVHDVDEGIRFNASLEGMAGLDTLSEGGVLTAGSSSQICDGTGAALVVSEQALKAYNLTPLARIVEMTVTAGDPVLMVEEPVNATDKALQRSGLSINDIDLFEVNEAFAPVPLAWLQYTGADPEKTNVNGGAIAIGHPLGATGVRLMSTLINELRASGGRYGLLTMCERGGTANATIVEAC